MHDATWLGGPATVALDEFEIDVPTPETLMFAGGVQSQRFRKSQGIDLALDAGTYGLVCFVPPGQTRHWEQGGDAGGRRRAVAAAGACRGSMPDALRIHGAPGR